MLTDPAQRATFNMGAFMSRNGKDKRFPEMEALSKELKGKFKNCLLYTSPSPRD